MAAEESGFSERLLARYDRLIATLANEGVERKGATMPYTSHNGHMFSFLTKEGKLAMRMPADEVSDFIKRFGGRRCRQHGVVLKEYVEVTDDLFKKTSTLAWYFGLSWMHVASLPPKGGKKKKATKKKAGAKKKAAAKKKAPAKKKKSAAKKTRARAPR
jgi:hypothetical protein